MTQTANVAGSAASAASESPVLEIRDLKTYYFLERATVRALDGVDLKLEEGTTLGLVGESGCGKSQMAMSVMRLLPSPPGKIVSGEILLRRRDGSTVDIAKLDARGSTMRNIRGGEIAIVFQEPMTSMNPLLTIGDQIAEAVRVHQKGSKKDAMDRAFEMLTRVQMSAPQQRLREYPHQLSGGMRQRAMIALALSCNPTLLLADEPTTALDATVQIQVLLLIRELQREFNLGVIFVTHDIGVAVEVSDRIGVMYAGKLVEMAPVERMVDAPQHPYSRGLLASTVHDGMRGQRLESIPGAPPDLAEVPSGCSFAPRCKFVRPDCTTAVPALRDIEAAHAVRCVLAA